MTNVIKDKRFLQNLMDSTVNEYLDIYPTYFKDYKFVRKLEGNVQQMNLFIKCNQKKQQNMNLLL